LGRIPESQDRALDLSVPQLCKCLTTTQGGLVFINNNIFSPIKPFFYRPQNKPSFPCSQPKTGKLGKQEKAKKRD